MVLLKGWVCVSGCKPLKTSKNFSGTGSFWHLSCLKETPLGLGDGLVRRVLATRAPEREFDPKPTQKGQVWW